MSQLQTATKLEFARLREDLRLSRGLSSSSSSLKRSSSSSSCRMESGSPERQMLKQIHTRIMAQPVASGGAAAGGLLSVDFSQTTTWPAHPEAVPQFARLGAEVFGNADSIEKAMRLYFVPTQSGPAVRDVELAFGRGSPYKKKGWTSRAVQGERASKVQTAFSKMQPIFKKFESAAAELGNSSARGQVLVGLLQGCKQELEAKLVALLGGDAAAAAKPSKSNMKKLQALLRSEMAGAKKRSETAKRRRSDDKGKRKGQRRRKN